MKFVHQIHRNGVLLTLCLVIPYLGGFASNNWVYYGAYQYGLWYICEDVSNMTRIQTELHNNPKKCQTLPLDELPVEMHFARGILCVNLIFFAMGVFLKVLLDCQEPASTNYTVIKRNIITQAVMMCLIVISIGCFSRYKRHHEEKYSVTTHYGPSIVTMASVAVILPITMILVAFPLLNRFRRKYCNCAWLNCFSKPPSTAETASNNTSSEAGRPTTAIIGNNDSASSGAGATSFSTADVSGTVNSNTDRQRNAITATDRDSNIFTVRVLSPSSEEERGAAAAFKSDAATWELHPPSSIADPAWLRSTLSPIGALSAYNLESRLPAPNYRRLVPLPPSYEDATALSYQHSGTVEDNLTSWAEERDGSEGRRRTITLQPPPSYSEI